MRIRIFLIICMLISSLSHYASEVSIIPKPKNIEINEGFYELSGKDVIGYSEGLKNQASYLKDVIYRSTGFDLRIKKGKADINLSVDKSYVSESYFLKVTNKAVNIVGADNGGIFYGIQTLLQLFPPEIYSDKTCRRRDWKARSVTIFDVPERPWRGMMLDVARYFYDKEFVKKYIDLMAMYKLNKLQFHLVDDSGWRLEIKKYPLLTKVGAWAGTDTNRLGGYYTQEDMKEIIEYAKLRNVEIIPEIEFPAHILSAVVAYPWLSCTEDQHELPTQHFISRDLLCVGKESSYEFLSDVLDEVSDLFPSKYINIGGDEAVYVRWESCPKCQKLMKDKGFEKASELHGYLTNVVSGMMKKKGRIAIGWEEVILRGKVNDSVIPVFWHDVKDTIQATRLGHKAILSPATHLYFDFPESGTPGEIKAASWMPPISLETCYSLPVNDYSPSSTVIGVQGCFWTDQFIHGTVLQELPQLNENRSERYAEYLTFPRLIALSEVGWKKKSECDFQDFKNRLKYHYRRLDYKDCHYRVPEPDVSYKEMPDGRLQVSLTSNVEHSVMRYSTDGSYPNIHSDIYKEPVVVNDKDKFLAIDVISSQCYSLPTYRGVDYSRYAKYGKFVSQWDSSTFESGKNVWRFEGTGKISGNGSYVLTLLHRKGKNEIKIENIKIIKRKEVLIDMPCENIVGNVLPIASYKFDIADFEAGTPFYIELTYTMSDGCDTSGLVFIKRTKDKC